MAKCCLDCFADRLIRQKVARQSEESGYCDRCSTHRAVRVDCSELSSDFSTLLSLYSESDDGERLVDLISRDWQIFSTSVSDNSALLDAILPGTSGLKYANSHPLPGDAERQWLELKEELKYKNRFFPASAPDKDGLAELLGLLVISRDDLAPVFFRARVQREDTPFELADLKAPPAGVAQAGRANPPGLSYLYVASDVETAVSEVRPTVADVVTVCRFLPVKNFKLIDLSEPRSLVSPFALDLGSLSNVRASMGLLVVLSEDLTKPAPPHKAAYDYLPTQYLCELIKNLGYDGVKYRSSLNSGGNNFAFFDVEALSPEDLNHPIQITGVTLATG